MPQPAGRPPHRKWVEVGALDADMSRVVPAPISESAPPITPGDGHRLSAVGDDQIARVVEGAWLSPSSVVSFSPGDRPADHDRPVGEPVEIESVHRLPELEQQVVGGVHHRVHGPNAARLEPAFEPVGETRRS